MGGVSGDEDGLKNTFAAMDSPIASNNISQMQSPNT